MHQDFHLSFKKLGPPLLQRFTTKIPYTSKPLKGLSVGFLPLPPPFLCLFCAPASLPTQKKGDKRKMCSVHQTCLSHSNLEPTTYRLAQPSPEVSESSLSSSLPLSTPWELLQPHHTISSPLLYSHLTPTPLAFRILQLFRGGLAECRGGGGGLHIHKINMAYLPRGTMCLQPKTGGMRGRNSVIYLSNLEHYFCIKTNTDVLWIRMQKPHEFLKWKWDFKEV